MSKVPSKIVEVRRLADAICSGTIDIPGYARLDELLRDDLIHCQTFVEYMDFHADLIRRRRGLDDEQHLLDVLAAESLKKPVRFSVRNISIGISIVVTACAMAFVLVGWPLIQGMLVPSQIGVISTVSADVEWQNQKLEPGDIVRRLDRLHLLKGAATIETLSGSTISLLGPCVVKLDQSLKTDLITGTVAVKVVPQDHGYTISTFDGQVVDLGTKFVVERDGAMGTRIAVEQGRVRATLIDGAGIELKSIELTAGHAGQLDRNLGTAGELNWDLGVDQLVERMDRVQAGIKRVNGAARISSQTLANMTEGDIRTSDHVLIVPERRGVVLKKPLSVKGMNGTVTLGAGTVVDSYLVHYDPGEFNSRAPVGSVEFDGKILAVIGSVSELLSTDGEFAMGDARFSTEEYRGLETGPDLDQVTVDDGGDMLSFNLHMLPPNYLDQCRVLVARSSQ
ncbi:FecR family protein [Calycomorphotria hydatis]|uniref:FecR protein n=1 Tax=Calycomorphotria hydatis TaxID=2528027 RepID=A0A517TDR3_9PLAN|nr:hypothetical protein [Calycomorphotria hydatis]QDT66511.1 FecR protein [Calycomorphotria hydatis]